MRIMQATVTPHVRDFLKTLTVQRKAPGTVRAVIHAIAFSWGLAKGELNAKSKVITALPMKLRFGKYYVSDESKLILSSKSTI